jgi:hypothetical protein
MTDRRNDPVKHLLIRGISALNGKTEKMTNFEGSDADLTRGVIITGLTDLFPRP